MRRFAALLLLVLPACAGRLYSATKTSTSGAPDDVYQCVQNQFKTMGYRRIQFDAMDRWFLAEKEEAGVQVSSGLYRKTWMTLDTRVRPNADGTTVLEITAHSYQEYASARGPDRTEQPVSSRAKLDAKALHEACAPQP